MSKPVDNQNCIYCGDDTSPGSGKFINRVPGGFVCDEDSKEYRTGYACESCMTHECDRCTRTINMDEDITAYDVYGEEDTGEFNDGSYRICHDCLTEEEKQILEENNN